MTRPEVVRAILRSHKSTLWGRAFDVSDADGLNDAVDFILSLLARIDAANNDPTVRDRHAVL